MADFPSSISGMRVFNGKELSEKIIPIILDTDKVTLNSNTKIEKDNLTEALALFQEMFTWNNL